MGGGGSGRDFDLTFFPAPRRHLLFYPQPVGISLFWAHLCNLHGGLICVAFCLSVCLSVLSVLSVWTGPKITLDFNSYLDNYVTCAYHKMGSCLRFMHVACAYHKVGSLPTSSCIFFFSRPPLAKFFSSHLVTLLFFFSKYDNKIWLLNKARMTSFYFSKT